MSELKPCPFCGGEPRWFWNGTVSVVRCMTCCASIGNNLSPTEDKEIRKAEAIAAWNTRVDYHGYEQAAIEAWESIKAWNSRAERTCHWELEHSGTLYDKWRCSKCGYLFVEPRCDQGYTDLEPNYCPNCGRRCI